MFYTYRIEPDKRGAQAPKPLFREGNGKRALQSCHLS